MIFDIMRYAIHDGPGIRTTLFFKGCPLDCIWCHNPEGKSREPEFMWWKERCIQCRNCQNACSRGAISFPDDFSLEKAKCDLCRSCVDACPSRALEMVGEKMTVPQLMMEIEKDTIFYEESGGGVTFSGGEPLMQPGLLYSLLKACKARGIHTAVDTCGYANPDVFRRISSYVDLFLYDVKVINDQTHKKVTGVSNMLILENLRVLSQMGKKVIVRYPLIPGMNDREEDIRELGAFISSINVEEISILPYHKGGMEKARRLGKQILVVNPSSAETVNKTKDKLKRYGPKVEIGG